ncbi:MAG: anti-sigma factor domain-containing protein [Deinococcus sp.]
MSPPERHPTDLLPDYLLGSLERGQQQELETHLLGCAACRAQAGTLRDALFSLADDLPAVPAPPGSWERIQARRAESRAGHTVSPPAGRSSRLPLWPLAAAVTLILALGGYVRFVPVSGQPAAQLSAQHWVAQGAQRLILTSKNGAPYGELFVRADGRALVILKRRAAAGQVYQAWGRPGNGPRAGVPTSLGLTDGTVMEVSWQGYDSIGVSIEPTGGSPAPTHPLGRTRLPQG